MEFRVTGRSNTIEYKFNAGDQGNVYLDYMMNYYYLNPDPRDVSKL
ncbi:hypothetical protein [Paenibacillus terrigena]|nr:hypothetical protein [Paenibacillus terrigena]